ncbi:MAG: hypothetical protein ABF629_06325 [Sporolactobacillus sp.]
MFYREQEHFEIRILDDCLRAVEDKIGTAYLDVSLRNLTKLPVTIIKGGLSVKVGNAAISRHNVVGFSGIESSDFRMEIPPHSERTGDLHLTFTSNDCVRLGLDEYGVTDRSFTFELELYDTLENCYCTKIENADVYAKGKLLWKVQLKYKKNH